MENLEREQFEFNSENQGQESKISQDDRVCVMEDPRNVSSNVSSNASKNDSHANTPIETTHTDEHIDADLNSREETSEDRKVTGKPEREQGASSISLHGIDASGEERKMHTPYSMHNGERHRTIQSSQMSHAKESIGWAMKTLDKANDSINKVRMALDKSDKLDKSFNSKMHSEHQISTQEVGTIPRSNKYLEHQSYRHINRSLDFGGSVSNDGKYTNSNPTIEGEGKPIITKQKEPKGNNEVQIQNSTLKNSLNSSVSLPSNNTTGAMERSLQHYSMQEHDQSNQGHDSTEFISNVDTIVNLEATAWQSYYFHKWYHITRLHMLNRVRLAKADLFYARQTKIRRLKSKQKFFAEWRLKTKLKQESNMLNDLADLFYENMLKTSCIKHWKQFSKSKNTVRSLDVIADNHYARSLGTKAFYTWCGTVENVQKQLLKTYYYQWKSVSQHSKLLTHYENLFKEQRKKFIKFLSFQQWKKCYSLIQLHRELVLYNRDKQLIKSFQHWRIILAKKKEYNTVDKLSNDYYNRKLLSMGFKALLLNKHANQIKVNRRRKLLHQFFVDWKCKLDIKLYWKELSRMARVQYETKLQQQVIIQWKKYVEYRREKERKNAYAIYYYETKQREKIKAFCFIQWKNYCTHQRRNHFDKCKAEIFYKYIHFMQLKRIYHQHIALKDEMAALHFRISKLRQAFSMWRIFVEHRQISKRIKQSADQLYEDHLKRQFLHIWHMSYKLREVEGKMADNFYKTNLLKCTFTSLAVAYDHKQAKQVVLVQNFRKRWSMYKLYEIFMSWRVFSNHHLRKQHDTQRANTFRRQTLLFRYFKLWNRRAVDREMLSISQLLSEVSIMNQSHELERSTLVFEMRSKEQILNDNSNNNHSILSSKNSRMSDSIAYDEEGIQVSSIIVNEMQI